MKKFELKSLIAGIIIGTTGITTIFAASNIKSANISKTKVFMHH